MKKKDLYNYKSFSDIFQFFKKNLNSHFRKMSGEVKYRCFFFRRCCLGHRRSWSWKGDLSLRLGLSILRLVIREIKLSKLGFRRCNSDDYDYSIDLFYELCFSFTWFDYFYYVSRSLFMLLNLLDRCVNPPAFDLSRSILLSHRQYHLQ